MRAMFSSQELSKEVASFCHDLYHRFDIPFHTGHMMNEAMGGMQKANHLFLSGVKKGL